MFNTLESYDTTPFPKAERIQRAVPAVVEAGVLQELHFLNAVYESTQSGLLTEEQAFELTWMLGKSMDDIYESADDIVFSESGEVYRAILERCIIDLPVGENVVLPKSVIYESNKPGSIYNAPVTVRKFEEDTSYLAQNMNNLMDYLEDELCKYTESYGEEGFDDTGVIAYLENMTDETGLTLKSYLEAAILTASITNRILPEDGIAMLSFVESCIMDEQAIPAMSPVVEPTGTPLQKQPVQNAAITEEPKKPLVPPVTCESAEEIAHVANTLLNAAGWYTMEAAKVYKNNPVFDTTVKKLYMKINKYLNMANPENADESFSRALSMHKNAYRFSFKDLSEESSEKDVDNFVRASILSTGFKPVKNDKRVIEYTMDKGDIVITVSFESVHLGISMDYEQKAAPVAESAEEETSGQIISLEADNIMRDRIHAVLEKTYSDIDISRLLDTLDGSSMVDRFNQIKTNWGEYNDICEAVDTLIAAMEKNVDVESDESLDDGIDTICTTMFTESVIENDLVDYETMIEASKEDIDPKMKPIIDLLNRLGYETKYSSAGYREERSKDDRDKNGVYYGKLYSTARITFGKNYQFDRLPKGWYQNFNSDKTGIYVKPITHNEKDGNPDEAFSKWQEEYMDALKDWAENLEEAGSKEDQKDSE